MTINVENSLSLKVNEQKVISATFGPKNVNNKKIHVNVDDNNLVSVTNNDTSSVTLSGVKIGSTHIKVTSLANNELVKEFDISITAKDTINEDNYRDFHKSFRKSIGHFALFFVTAIFGMIFLYTYFEDIRKIWILGAISLGTGIFVAGISELIQYFIPSRGGVLLDVGIDSLGYLIGTLVTIGIICLIWFIKKKISAKSTTD